MNWKKGFRRVTVVLSIVAFFVPGILLLLIPEEAFMSKYRSRGYLKYFKLDVPFVDTFRIYDTAESILTHSLFFGFLAFVLIWIFYFLLRYSFPWIIIPIIKWIKSGFTDNTNAKD